MIVTGLRWGFYFNFDNNHEMLINLNIKDNYQYCAYRNNSFDATWDELALKVFKFALK